MNKKKNKDKKKRKPCWFRRLLIWAEDKPLRFVIIVVYLFVFIRILILGYRRDIQLKDRGIATQGYVYDITYGGNGKWTYKYRYFVNGHMYRSWSPFLEKRVGDTLTVFYLPENPSVSRPKERLY